MRKNFGNEKVLKAITIGLSAMMAVSSMPMTVLADEIGEGGSEENNYSSSEETASETTDEARVAVKETEASVDIVVNDVKVNAANIEEEVANTVIPVYGADGKLVTPGLDENIQNAETELEAVDASLTTAEKEFNDWVNGKDLDGNGYQKGYTEYKKATDDIAAAQAENEEMKAANTNIETAVEGAASAAGAVASAASDATDIANQAETDYKDLVDQIENAKSKGAANQAYQDLTDMLDQAVEDIQGKQDAYDIAKGLYEKALEDYIQAQNDYSDASEEYDKKEQDYNRQVERREIVDKRIKAYNDALNAAKAGLEEAQNDLAAAKAQAVALEQAANKAKANIIINAGDADIVAKLDIVKSDGENEGENGKGIGIDYGHQDNLFKSIIENYTLPNNGITPDAGSLKITVKKVNTTALGPDGNYFEVTYTVNGEEKTEYYNYVMSDSSKKGHESMVIFKKRDNEVAASNAYKNANVGKEKITLYEQGLTEDQLDAYEVDGKRLEKSDFDSEKGNGEIVKVGNIWYQKGLPVPDVTVSYDPETGFVSKMPSKDGTTLTEVKVDTKTVSAEYVIDEESGELKQKFTGDVTTLVYTKNSLSVNPEDGEKVYANEEAAEAQITADGVFTSEDAAQAALGQDTQDLDVIDSEITKGEYSYYYTESVEKTKTTYQASGSYVPMFTDTIEVSKTLTYDTKIGADLSIWAEKIGIENGILDQYKDDYIIYYNGNYYDLKDFDFLGLDKLELRDDLFELDDSYIGSRKVKDGVIFDDYEYDYSVNGTATISYVSKSYVGSVDPKQYLLQNMYAFFDDVFGDGSTKTTEQIKAAVEEEFAKEGKYIYDWSAWNWAFGTGTVKYINSVAVSGEAKDSEADADASLETALDTAISNSSLKTSAASNKTTTLATDFKDYKGDTVSTKKQNDTYTEGIVKYHEDVVKTGTIKTYGYSAHYWEQAGSSTEKNALLQTNVYEGAKKVYGIVDQNKNYNPESEDNLVVAENEEFQEFVRKTREGQKQIAIYERLASEAAAAKDKVDEAQGVVDLLSEKIKGDGYRTDVKQKADGTEMTQRLPESSDPRQVPEWNLTKVKLTDKEADYLTQFFSVLGIEFDVEKLTIEDLSELLVEAQEELTDAKEKVDDLKNKLSEVEDILKDTLRRLTPPDRGGDGDEGGLTGGTTYFAGTTTTPGALMAALPTSGVAGVRAPRANRGVTAAAGEEEVTGENKAIETVKPAVKSEEKKETKKTVTTKIEDDTIPLGATPIEETNNMSWWWLLLVAVLGATGYEMYKKHQQKKAEAEAVSETIKKED